jgi:FMN phosphatase YigB (HAD superfamily)
MAVAPRHRPAAVIFDVGGTILEERWFDLDAAFRAVVSDARLAGDLLVEFRHVLSERHRTNREVALAGWLLERVPNITVTLQELEDALWLHVVELVPFSTVGDVLAQLTADRIPVAAISNAYFSGRVLAGELGRHGLLNHFRFVMSSADFGWRKPHAAIFETALDRLGVRASGSWFVGDTLAEDILGAHEAGLQPIWLSQDEDTPVPTRATRIRDWESFGRLYGAARADREAG